MVQGQEDYRPWKQAWTEGMCNSGEICARWGEIVRYVFDVEAGVQKVSCTAINGANLEAGSTIMVGVMGRREV
jgi:hypothetical protein